jgi:NAD(P)-dependent dehydrogenase (short-subunit alcohol dehydrogenase family)
MSYLEQLFSLEGKTALVTGASRGLGRAIADALLRAGASVILVSANPDRLDEATSVWQSQGLPAISYACDLADKAQISALLETVYRDPGRMDILVNAAGITEGHALLDYPDEVWERTLQVNLSAAFYLARGLAPLLAAQKSGSIINITSINAEQGFPGNPAYVAAKGALKQLSKALAVDLGPQGIRVNTIGPGYFHTDMTSGSWNDPERRAQRSSRTLLGRWGEPEDLAGLVIFLASSASSYMTGQDIYIDGGWLAKGL